MVLDLYDLEAEAGAHILDPLVELAQSGSTRGIPKRYHRRADELKHGARERILILPFRKYETVAAKREKIDGR
jgi:hypothetical protein